ncbi:hypothetical protein I5677_14645 [Mobilitalea sibirica]|uniref:Uncharacterized protein n=1 Tax=Mobilitalea sibirica TaxID=1462919 RepID=A0A8J7L0E0_9FIRM|nr:hypothetical protein [Mobilitalea sibirica]MBH1942138.1 hypothetical protein [Mobilitalea sibirica]
MKYELTNEAIIIYCDVYSSLCIGWKYLCNACKKAEELHGKERVIMFGYRLVERYKFAETSEERALLISS